MQQKISLITTGGTIASKETKNGMLSSGALSGKELASLCQLKKEIDVKIIDLFQIPSMYMDFEKMVQLKNTVEQELQDPYRYRNRHYAWYRFLRGNSILFRSDDKG